MNNTQETVIFDPNQILGILDLRSLGYYKIKQGVLQQNLSKNYHFESVEKLCEEFNAIINARKKEEEQETENDKYPWLDDSDERKYMTDSKIFRKIYKFGQLMFDRIRKGTTKRYDLQI